MVITEAGVAERVTGLVYLSSLMADAGESQAQLTSAEPAPWMRPGDDGTVGVDPELIRRFFLQDCDEPTTEAAIARLTRQAMRPFSQAPRNVAWRERPATYIVCTEDLATPADVQRARVRPEASAVEFDAGHHPFLSRPDAFADTLAAVVENVPASG